MSKILVIADTHLTPSQCEDSLRYWGKLGKYIVKTKPDYIVHLGDVADMNSLMWRKNARGVWTTEEELENVKKHLQALEEPIRELQDKNRHDKKTIYRPKKVLCLGNHDTRNDYTGIEIAFRDHGWDVYDYLQPANIDGVTFCHAMLRGMSESPCVTARELLEEWHGDVVVGHSHRRDYAEAFCLASNELIHAIKCPMLYSKGSDWSVQGSCQWARGFTEIRTNPFRFIWRDICELQSC